ncbi:Zn(II)2Cys6 transcription factor [Aspergillus ibericus CBS 121593]|uniref:Fungal-specific transcription factor domain protein n=1 Tax=Aspergillus ibericus CBS 121593 TaxID=1448316 RepID=A0A395GUE2_9EURO|nr:fungal-specific transcription factor domain protein [Aspergillus ibericus CBS 121593]RAK97723.1 fungal-specific transcription factor domain protein [Aspergillus ibericus CBS 121593]
MNPTDPTGSAPVNKPKVRLSCETCRQRKVKCDKLDPCTNCQRLGARCVPVERARLPRGRSGRLATERPGDQDANLKDRVSKLESILRDLARGGSQASARAILAAAVEEGSQDGENSLGDDDSQAGGVRTPDTYLGSSFWANLLNEVPDMHPSERRSSKSDDHDAENRNLISYRRLLTMASGGGIKSEPVCSSPTHQQLCCLFMQRVDPLCKILHRPTLKAFLVDGSPYLDYEPGHLAPTALAYSVYYAASCSLIDEESMRCFGIPKSSMVARYHKEAETALARADFITTNDLTVLQAYVLFLLALRSQDQSRRMWTMLSMALRIGQALSLHLPDPPFHVRPFERELRRRLWIAIGFLDVQASMDRASEPMMQASWLESHPPANVNDIDLSPNMEANPVDSPGFTDMTFTMMMHKSQYVARSLNFSDFMEPSITTLAIRQQLVLEFKQSVTKLLHHSNPDHIPLHWLTRAIAECTHASLQLITLRPLQRAPNFTPPHVRGDRLLEFAVNVLILSRRLRSDPRFATYQWFEFAFPPWHCLAVALAELCVCDDQSVMERFWDPIEDTFHQLGRLIADSQRGMLWKPMEKIMARARERRAQLLATDAFSPSTTTTIQQQQPQQQQQQQQQQQPPIPIQIPPQDFIPGMHTDTQVGLDQAVAAMNTPESVDSTWPNVWDAVDFSYAAPGPAQMAWTSYGDFVAEFYVNVDDPLVNR